MIALTHRESQVLKRIVQGKGNAAIAYELGVNVKTVEVFTGHIYKKAGVHSYRELIAKLLSEVLAA